MCVCVFVCVSERPSFTRQIAARQHYTKLLLLLLLLLLLFFFGPSQYTTQKYSSFVLGATTGHSLAGKSDSKMIYFVKLWVTNSSFASVALTSALIVGQRVVTATAAPSAGRRRRRRSERRDLRRRTTRRRRPRRQRLKHTAFERRRRRRWRRWWRRVEGRNRCSVNNARRRLPHGTARHGSPCTDLLYTTVRGTNELFTC